MVHNKRSKNSRQRGSWTHGWGSKKKHRGAGHRGGRGRAGSGKKGDAKKNLYWKTDKFGKDGFVSIHKDDVSINLSQLYLIMGQDKKINLTEKGYDKLLGAGTIKEKIEVIVEKASAKAIVKIEKAGGKVILPEKKTVVKKETVEKKKPAVVEEKVSENVAPKVKNVEKKTVLPKEEKVSEETEPQKE